MHALSDGDLASPTNESVASRAGGLVRTSILSLVPPIAAGLVAFGFRGAMTTLLVLGGTFVGYLAWRTVGRRGPLLRPRLLLWQALVLSALLPAHLASLGTPTPEGLAPVALWPAPVAAGLGLTAIAWLLGGPGGGRIVPAVVAFLLTAFAFGDAVTPRLVLDRSAVVAGDLLDYERSPLDALGQTPWLTASPRLDDDPEARWRAPAGDVLAAYTPGLVRPPATMGGVLRERLPPLEDLIVIGHPTAFGLGSIAAIFAAGTYLCVRGAGDVRIAVASVLAAYGTFLLAPVPAAVTADGTLWTWAIGLGGGIRGSPSVGWDVGVTFAHYELFSGPICFIALLLAPLPATRPLRGRWRVLYGLALGISMAAAQRVAGPQLGPLTALLVIGLLPALADRVARARAIV